MAVTTKNDYVLNARKMKVSVARPKCEEKLKGRGSWAVGRGLWRFVASQGDGGGHKGGTF